MAKRYSLPCGFWSGKTANVRITWNNAAKQKLPRYAGKQRVDQWVLKGVAEHLMCELAHKMGCKRVVIRNPPHDIAILGTKLSRDRKSHRLCMEGTLLTSRGAQQARIYLETNTAPTKFDELKVVGEVIMVPFGSSQALALDLDYSWGVGTETWAGPTIGGGRLPSGPATESQSDMVPPTDSTPEARPGPRCAAPTAGCRPMNPRAAEFYPRAPIIPEYRADPQTWSYPSLTAEDLGAAFADQYPADTGRRPAFSEMVPPMVGYYSPQVDPWVGVPFAHGAAQPMWHPGIQEPKYYNYGTQRWEPAWFGPPHIFGHA